MKKLVFSLLLSVFMIGLCQRLHSQNYYQNPILKGFYPDPSICRVGSDYYMVTSTFEYFPGVPIFHSKDLVNWNQIGHVLSRPSQLNLDSVRISGGIYAPTIRYHNGTFYMITTLIGTKQGGNFFVTAKSPAGPWSDPQWLPKEAIGIDPSLFFDDDGKVYYTGNKKPINQAQETRYRQIWLQEVDLKTRTFVGERSIILEEGALHGAHNAEAPHIYKKDGYYYLVIAEGGTADNHAVTIFRSKNISGPYEGNKKNPILTHRHLGVNYPITATGHADFVDTQNGEWWMVLLGIRKYGGLHYNLGRETFLAKIEWQDGWPIVNPGEGKVLAQQLKPNLPEFNITQENLRDDFSSDTLFHYWNFLRTPRTDFWSLSKRKGFLRLQLGKAQVSELAAPSFVGRRQQDSSFTAETSLQFNPKKENELAGMVLMMNGNFQYRLEKILQKGKPHVQLIKRFKGVDEVVNTIAIEKGDLVMGINAKGQDLDFYIKQNGKKQNLAIKADGRILSVVNAGGFTGVYIGLYASSKGIASSNYADFDWFEYKGL
ncbi:Non-reducing end alpha-L-arabinofuranosidase BoGH43B [Pedobacter glucosidilyticus]|nr:glycoside hydrolase family 43 protein [Pedobacter glucosidilyticus]KHJ37434.1 Non-reducing end alpha-L-arabinofuranosidase BoGH43B [Pedobacter glucosidilyticus]